MKLHADGVVLALYVQPRASRTRWMGVHDGRLKIALAAPPVEGQANKALVAFLASELKTSRSDVRLLSGQTGRRKRALVTGLTVSEVLSRLPA